MRKRFFPVFLLLLMCTISCEDSKEKSGPTDVFTSEKVVYNTSPEEIEVEAKNRDNLLFNSEAVEEVYSSRDFSPLWKNRDRRNSLVLALQKANEEGLSFKYYHGDLIEKILNSAELSEKEASRLEVLLSDAFLSYAHDLYFGRLDPTKLHENWGVTREKRDFKELILKAAEEKEVDEIFAELKPQSDVYRGLKKSLSEFQGSKQQENSFEKIPSGELVKPGEEDPRIPAITARLEQLGLLDSLKSNMDMLYSEEIQKAVKQFQEKQGLKADGIVGNSTISQLNMSNLDRTNQILANLERWRWYPRDLGDHYVLVNIADFRLAVVKDGDTVREHKVVAGSKQRKTPIFSDTIEYIVINPQWHVPPTIKKEDVIPKARRDVGYLRSHDLQVMTKSGKVVNPDKVDWSSNEPFDYNYVQVAGPSNPLGRVKIIYPNKYLIYLHDTPAKSLFAQNERAESSGCVRVENAIDLAAYVVEDQPEWTKENILQTISMGATKEVKVNRPIQVHHFYWTAWRAGGKTKFINDIYELDKKIYSQLN